MKVAFVLTACLLAYGSSQSLFLPSLKIEICSLLEDVIPGLVTLIDTRFKDLCLVLDAVIPPDDPRWDRIDYFKAWIRMKLDMIISMAKKGKGSKDRFPDICKLAQFIKFYVCIMLEWLHQLRCEIRELDCYLITHGLDYADTIRQILADMDEVDRKLLTLTKRFQVFYFKTHCTDNLPWDGVKAGKAMGPSEMISKPEGDIMITGNAFNFLDDDIIDTSIVEMQQLGGSLRNALENHPNFTGNTDAGDAMDAVDSANEGVDAEAKAILDTEERNTGDICSYTAEYRDFLCDLMEDNQLLRNKVRELELFLKKILGKYYKYSKFKKYIDRLYHYFYKVDYYTIKIGLLYIDFFIKVHCDFDDCWCIIRGDPVVKTCDQAYLYLQGAGYYLLAHGQAVGNCNEFYVYIKVQMVYGIPTPVKMIIYYRVAPGVWIVIVIMADHVVMVNGQQILNFPYPIPGTQVTLNGVGNDFKLVETECAYFAFWYIYPMSKGKVHLDNDYIDRVSGLCGDYDRNPYDDRRLANGTSSDNDGQISNSFRMDSLPPPPTN